MEKQYHFLHILDYSLNSQLYKNVIDWQMKAFRGYFFDI